MLVLTNLFRFMSVILREIQSSKKLFHPLSMSVTPTMYSPLAMRGKLARSLADQFPIHIDKH